MRGSIRDVFIGWVPGDELAGKGYTVTLQNCGRAIVKPKTCLGGLYWPLNT